MFGDVAEPSRSLMVVPIRQGAHTIGILSVQSYRLNAYDKSDLELFQMFADYAAGALNRIAAEEERSRVEQRLKEQAALLDIAQDAILVKDLEDRIIYWNKGAERTYGWTALEAVGRKAATIHKDHAKFCESMDAILKHGEWTGEMTQQTKDGRDLVVQVRMTLVRDHNENPKAILAINTDVTDKKRLEEQILRGQRLESIGTLAGGIAHDLNNVLAPILMSVQMLRQIVNTPEGQAMLDTLQTSSQRGADLIKQVLSFARGVEGKRGPINVSHLTRDLEKVVHDTFPKNIQLQIEAPKELWTIEGDPTHIHQVLMNLCVNARDAMPDGGKLTLGIKNVKIDEAYARMNPEGKPGPHVVVTVEDTGMGIPAAIRNKIFDPFFTTKEIGKGTGLGLATVLTIVKSHHGFINVYSEPGKGAQFKIYFPASPHQAVTEQVVTRTRPIAARQRRTNHDRRRRRRHSQHHGTDVAMLRLSHSHCFKRRRGRRDVCPTANRNRCRPDRHDDAGDGWTRCHRCPSRNQSRRENHRLQRSWLKRWSRQAYQRRHPRFRSLNPTLPNDC